MRANEWLEAYGVAFDWRATGYQLDASGWEHHAYVLTLSTADATVEIPWRQGLAIDAAPTAGDALPAIASEARYGELDWQDYCSEFGYDELEAPVSDLRTHEALRALRASLYAFCASEAMWEDFLTIEEGE
jgi:hypothetical protein